MRTRLTASVVFGVLGASLALPALCLAQAADQGPVINIPESSLKTRLLPGDEAQIEAYAKYWVEKLLAAADSKGILDARRKLLEGFAKYDQADFKATGYRYTFAGKATGVILPAIKGRIKGDDPLGSVKQVNLSLALTEMPEVSIRPALDEMVRRGEPHVRYLGWLGYAAIRTSILTQGSVATEAMLKTLRERAAEEKSPAVLAGMFQMLTLPVSGTSAIKDTLPKAQAAAIEAISSLWPELCRKMVAGNVESINSARYGLAALGNLFQAPSTGEEDRKKILQTIFDAMYCAGIAYDELAGGEGTVAELAVLLMTDAENALNTLTKAGRRHVIAPLTNPRLTMDERRTAVRLGVLSWLEELKASGVGKPAYQRPAGTTTAPTTGPAK